MSDRYAVVGNPVAHSLSPTIHAAFAQQTGQDLDYGRLLSPMDGFAATVRDFAAAGGLGCNVTVPFKFEVPSLARRCSPRVMLAGSANTLSLAGEDWSADNTDGLGLVADIEQHAGLALRGTTVLLLGAGGASAGVLGPILQARPRRVVVLNRTEPRAVELVQRHSAWAQEHGVELRAGGLEAARVLCGAGCEVLINGTASSLEGEAVPVDGAALRPQALALDMMYGPKAQAFLDWAAAHGAVPRDGLGMLVEQAAEAFFLWRGVRPQTRPVLQALRQAAGPAAAPGVAADHTRSGG